MKLAVCFALSTFVASAIAGIEWAIQIPNSRTVFTAGKVNRITWDILQIPAKNTTPPTAVRIDLLEGPQAQVVTSISNKSDINALRYDWNTPDNLKSASDYYIRIGSGVSDYTNSANFEIYNPPPPSTSVVIVTSVLTANATPTANSSTTTTAMPTTTLSSLSASSSSTSSQTINQFATEPPSGAGASMSVIEKWTTGMVMAMLGLMVIW